jgi:hypothetical protein
MLGNRCRTRNRQKTDRGRDGSVVLKMSGVRLGQGAGVVSLACGIRSEGGRCRVVTSVCLVDLSAGMDHDKDERCGREQRGDTLVLSAMEVNPSWVCTSWRSCRIPDTQDKTNSDGWAKGQDC